MVSPVWGPDNPGRPDCRIVYIIRKERRQAISTQAMPRQSVRWKADEATGTVHSYDHDRDVRHLSCYTDANARSLPRSRYERG